MLRNGFEHAAGLVHGAGQHEMPYYKPAHRNAVIIGFKLAHLPEHLGYGGKRILRVIGGAAEPLGKRGGNVLVVGQINVNKPVEQAQGLRLFIAVGVVDDGQLKPHFAREGYSPGDAPQMRRRGNEVYIVRAGLLQRKHDRGKPFLVRKAAGDIESGARYVDVLAENAAQIAARKEHRAAASCARNGRLLKIMPCGPCDKRVFARSAGACLPRLPVCAAV